MMKRISVFAFLSLGLFLSTPGFSAKVKTAKFRALASQEASTQDERYSILGLVQPKTFSVEDKKLGPVTLFMVDDGPAANTTSLILTVMQDFSPEGGVNSDVYKIGRVSSVNSAVFKDGKVTISGSRMNVELDKMEKYTLKVTYKDAKGERVVPPAVE